ncbi:multidrug and toxin extrusion protein 1 isoform X2 [Corythoichthys intestinalis]|nr:multidrug and toxin extrusion protein 1-like isoform X2 [Corythoichthys intestinalis]
MVIVQGLTMACDTLVSQTYGSKNLKRVGIILQRSSLILLLFCLPCWALLINAQQLLLLMRQDQQVARIAQIYTTAFIPAVPAMFLHQLQVAYLQNQGIILPQMYTAALANLFNLGANYVLIISLQLGVVGSAMANSLAQVFVCLLLYAYIRWKKLHGPTWAGWSSDCLQDWGSFIKLAVPSTFMVCFEWWIWEIGGFLAGILGEVDLAAQHVMVEISAITYMFPLGIHTAACVRVGNALGAGDTARAILSCKVALVLAALLAVLLGSVIVGSKSVLGFVFTSDKNIVDMVSKNLTIYTFLQFFDSMLCVCSGILVGCGMQKVAAMSNLVGYYCIGLPIGVALMFAAHLQIFGLWLGLLTCVTLEACFFLVLVFKLNWKKVTKEAEERAGKRVMETSKNHSMDGQETSRSQDRESEDISEKRLSTTQLVLRRGFALSAAVVTLAMGVAVHFVFPVPEIPMSGSVNLTEIWTNVSTVTPMALSQLVPADLKI